MEFFHVENSGIDREDIGDIYAKIQESDELRDFINAANEPVYLYWDDLKHRPRPSGVTAKQAWAAVKLSRIVRGQKTSMRMENGTRFSWVKLMGFERFCHEFDLNAGGDLSAFLGDIKREERQRLISKGIMDEAIASSQLEGADTGREYARKMLREGIRPRNQSDQMILNNHKAMLAIEDRYKQLELSRDLLSEMHSVLTEDVVDEDGEKPRWRNTGEDVFVHDKTTGVVYHKAPDIAFVNKEIDRLIAFANDDGTGEFIHPIIKATMMHFWIGYLHPFTDGNGRLARVVYYWYLLKNDYWAFGYLPLSSVIKKAPMQYVMAYVYSEQDDADVTYFVSYVFRKMGEAAKGFQKYLAETRRTNAQMAAVARGEMGLNDRQIQLLRFLNGGPDNYTSIKSHSSVNRISRGTAINDLRVLQGNGFVEKKQNGRSTYYYGTKKTDSLFSGHL